VRNIVTCDPQLSIAGEDKDSIAPATVTISGTITEESAVEARKAISRGEAFAIERGQGILPVIIDTFGGDVYALLGIIDAMDACAVPVATIAESKAMSCGAILLSCGSAGLRFAGRSATIMVHDISGWISGRIGDLNIEAREFNRLHRLLTTRLAKNCGKAPNFFDQEIHKRGRSDWYLTAPAAKKVGLIDHVGIPVFRTHIGIQYSLSLSKTRQESKEECKNRSSEDSE
jgi:ATP-dependent Clp endopeptidase proteolytic subunit ClpP